MLYPSINNLADQVDSKYTLVVMAAKRARQIINGEKPTIDANVDKAVSIATKEIAEGLINYSREDKYNVGV
ncbi:MAG: DNA-directed RNA polymerase subunit omega [Peptostreptococcales bacterium]